MTSFCLFAVFDEPFADIDAVIHGVAGLQKALVYTPDRAHDPFLNEDPPPPLVLQLYFASLPTLEAAGNDALQVLKGRCEVEAMAVRTFAVREPKKPVCTYLVGYEGRAEDEDAWHAHYLKHHLPLMARLPGLRELEICTPVVWVSSTGWRRRRCMQRNKVAFDSAEALSAALHSSVRKEMRADYVRLPAFNGRITHHPMATRTILLTSRSFL